MPRCDYTLSTSSTSLQSSSVCHEQETEQRAKAGQLCKCSSMGCNIPCPMTGVWSQRRTQKGTTWPVFTGSAICFRLQKVKDLKELLHLNDQSCQGNRGELAAKCADSAAFGRLPRCPRCSGGRIRVKRPRLAWRERQALLLPRILG